MNVLKKVFIIIAAALMVWLGFKRERYLMLPAKGLNIEFINKYPRKAVTDYEKEMAGLSGFSLSPKLTSSILYSISFALLTGLIIHLAFLNKKYTVITLLLFLAYMIVCFLLILSKNAGLPYELSVGLSHSIEDLFLSPFILMLLIPSFYLAAHSGKSVK